MVQHTSPDDCETIPLMAVRFGRYLREHDGHGSVLSGQERHLGVDGSPSLKDRETKIFLPIQHHCEMLRLS